MCTYSEIIERYGQAKVPYAELLQTHEWSVKRIQIITRENNICQHCCKPCIDDYWGNTPVIFEFAIKETPFYDLNGDLLDTYPREIMRRVVPKIPLFAQVHHTYYVLSRLPWEYPDSDLLLLCHKCHNHLHQTQEIKVYLTEDKLNTVTLAACGRCGGTGHLPQYDYVKDGICFVCNGAGLEGLR